MKKMDLLDGSSLFRPLYLIKNKDTVLGTFVWDNEDTAIAVSIERLPSFVSRSITGWLEDRTPPKHRLHMQELLRQLGLTTLKSMIDFSKGLSLIDTIWVVSATKDCAWSEVSLFVNPFDEVIARVAFDGGMHGMHMSTTTPEFATDGGLAKCWVRSPAGQIDLIKAGSTRFANDGNEPYSENLSHQVLSVLGYDHVPYSVERFHGKLVSRCPLFTSETKMFLPIGKYYSFQYLDELVTLCQNDGIDLGLAQHLVFDYLSWNTDRHAGNMGVLLDSTCFELLGFAPIFDNGFAMLPRWDGAEDLDSYTAQAAPALYRSFEQGAKWGKNLLGNRHNVQRLVGFKFDRAQLPGFPERRIVALEAWLQKRVQLFLSM